MSWLSRVWGSLQSKAASPVDLMREIEAGQRTAAGEYVNADKALQIAAVLACTRVVANGIAQVPWKLHRAVGDAREEARNHPLFLLIHRKPNVWQTSYEFRQTISLHLLLLGNAFVYLNRVGSQREVRAMEPIEPQRVTVKWDDGEKVLSYRVRADSGASVTLSADQVWHIRGPSWNSWYGLEPVNQARDALGLAIASEKTQSAFHAGGTQVSGVLSVEGQLSAEQFKSLSAWLARHQPDGDMNGRPLILDRGTKWSAMQMTGVDAQHLETRKHQIEEICRALGVFPQMVGHAGDQSPTFASAEAFFTAHVVHTLAPWYECIEQSADCALLTDQEMAEGYYTKFNPNGLMRGNAKDRAEFHAKALGSGGHQPFMTVNEVRAKEELPPMPGGDDLAAPATQEDPADA